MTKQRAGDGGRARWGADGAADRRRRPRWREAVDIPVADLCHDLRRAPQARGRRVLRVEVGTPVRCSAADSSSSTPPGVGGQGQPHLSATLGLLPDADAVLFVSDSSQEFTEPEMRFLRQAVEICPVAATVVTKTDLYPVLASGG